MRAIVIAFLVCCNSCTTFSNVSKFNKTENCYQAYVCISNEKIGLKYQSFGGIKSANDLQTYKTIKKGKKPHFKNVIIYGWSNNLNGDYYLLLNNKKKSRNYQFKDTILNNRKVTVALSKTINYKFNTDFLLNFDLNK
ncbi:Lipoprotein [Kaistella daneshvariae]